ncbi:hypothetical protein C7425_1188 [Pantoea ananatis]|nr:hypothetical protein C7425_1188 [Pantoea ananatis]
MNKPLRNNVLTGLYHIYSLSQSRINYGTMTADVDIISDSEIVIKQYHEDTPACNTVHTSRDGGITWVLE